MHVSARAKMFAVRSVPPPHTAVATVHCTADFVTITKEPAADWGHILEPVKLALTEHL